MKQMQEIDILNAIHGALNSTAMDYLSLAFEYVFKIGFIWIIIGLFLMRDVKTRKFGAALIIAMVIEFAAVYCLKFTIDRPRPFEVYDVEALITTFGSTSFPSGHTAQLFCAATVISVFRKKYAVPMFLLAFMVAVSRMYLYAHYPTDVLAGAIIGIAAALVTIEYGMRSNRVAVFVKIREDPEEISE